MADDVKDKELLARVARGDKGAMRKLFERHHDALFAFLRSRGADPQAAADALQDAMLDVWQRADRYGGQASVKTWIFAIARNKFIDRHRRTVRMTLTDDIPESVDPDPNPEAVLLAAGDADRVRACLSKLKPAHLSVIRLAFYDDLNYAEIGEIEGIPEGTVKTRIYHAKKLLLRCLGSR